MPLTSVQNVRNRGAEESLRLRRLGLGQGNRATAMVVSTLVELEPLRKVECRNWILAPILLPVLPEYTPRVERIISSVPLLAAAKHADKVRTVHGKHSTQLQKMVCCLYLFMWRTFIMVACNYSCKRIGHFSTKCRKCAGSHLWSIVFKY
jgi:hypothetical protein